MGLRQAPLAPHGPCVPWKDPAPSMLPIYACSESLILAANEIDQTFRQGLH
jgi:hypothetical protein